MNFTKNIITILVGAFLVTSFMGACAIKPSVEEDNTFELEVYRITPDEDADSSRDEKIGLLGGVNIESESIRVTIDSESMKFNVICEDSNQTNVH